MTVITDIITAGGILTLLGLCLRWLHGRMVRMEHKHCSDLYTSGHQPRYVTTDTCNTKFNELKQLLIDMDHRREEAKDLFAAGQRAIESRLTAIETKLEIG